MGFERDGGFGLIRAGLEREGGFELEREGGFELEREGGFELERSEGAWDEARDPRLEPEAAGCLSVR